MTRWTTRTALSLLCLSLTATAEEPCKRNKDGSVTCTEAGLKTLTDAVIDLRAKVKGLEAKKDALQLDLIEQKHLVQVCQEDLVKVSKGPDTRTILTGYGLGLLSVGLMGAGLVMDMPTDVRMSVVAIGFAGAFAGGAMLLSQ